MPGSRIFFALALSLFLADHSLAQFEVISECQSGGLSATGFRWVAQRDGYVMAVRGSRQLVIFDGRSLAGASAPADCGSPIKSFEDFGYPLVRYGNYLYGFTGGQINILDISDASSPVALPSVEAASSIDNWVLEGDQLYAVGFFSLQRYSLANPANPVMLFEKMFENNFRGFAIAVAHGLIYVSQPIFASQTYRIFIYDAQAEDLPVVNIVEVDSPPHHLRILDSMLVTCGDSEIELWSLVAPAEPVRIDRTGAVAKVCELVGDALFTNGRIFRVQSSGLAQVGTLPLRSNSDGFPYGTTTADGLVFLSFTQGIMAVRAPAAALFPQFVSGVAANLPARTRLALRNAGERPTEFTVFFQDQSGNPQDVLINGASASNFHFNLPPWGVLDVETRDTTGLKSGSIEVRGDAAATAQLEGAGIFELLGRFASVPAAPLQNTYQVLATVNTAERAAVAIYNPSITENLVLNVNLLDDQAMQEAVPAVVTVGPQERLAVFFDEPQLFGNFFAGLTTPFSGTAHFRAQAGQLFALTSLIQRRADGALLVVPSGARVISAN